MMMKAEIDKCAWLHIQDKQLLVARSRGQDTYYVPGGKRELGEFQLILDAHQAII